MANDAQNPTATNCPKRRWFAFSLRTLLLLITALALWLGYIVHAAHEQRDAISRLGDLGNIGYGYEYQLRPGGHGQYTDGSLKDPVPASLTKLVGVDFFHSVVDLGIVCEEAHRSTTSPVEQVVRLRRLRGLNLIGYDLKRQDIERLASLTVLSHLSMGDAQLDDDAIEPIEQIPGLTTLDLVNNRITDNGLLQLGQISGLMSLDLSENEITDAGLNQLLSLRQLDCLLLRKTRITDQGLEVLARMPQLTNLDLQQTRVTSEGVHRLQLALPNLKIFCDFDNGPQMKAERLPNGQ